MTYKNEKDFIICSSIVEIDKELYISEEIRIKRDDLFDLSAYGINSEELLSKKALNYRKMTFEEIKSTSEDSPSLKYLIEYLRDDKINQIFKK